MSERTKPPLETFHFPVVGLMVPKRWRVGTVLFHPAGRLAERLARDVAAFVSDVPGVDVAKELLAERSALIRSASASVRARDLADAREAARDAVAVLRLYQRTTNPRWSFDTQTFGLAADIGAALEEYFVTGRGQLPGHGARWTGVLADFTFHGRHVDAFRDDPRFAFLDDSLRVAPADRSDIQRRILTSLRVLNQATVMIPEPVRIVLLAVAIEILLNDEGELRGATYRLTQRAAYLWCGYPDDRHGPKRPPCLYLEARSEPALDNAIADRQKRGESAVCSYFESVYGLFADRNGVLHQGRQDFPRQAATVREGRVDGVLLATIDWASRSRATDLRPLDAEIPALGMAKGRRA